MSLMLLWVIADIMNTIDGNHFIYVICYATTMLVARCSVPSNMLCECVTPCRKLFYKILLKTVDLLRKKVYYKSIKF